MSSITTINSTTDKIKASAVAAKQHATDVARTVKRETAKYMLAGFVFAAGMAWNEFAKAGIEKYYPGSSEGVRPKFVYALTITLLVAFLSYLIIQTDIVIKSKQDEIAAAVLDKPSDALKDANPI